MKKRASLLLLPGMMIMLAGCAGGAADTVEMIQETQAAAGAGTYYEGSYDGEADVNMQMDSRTSAPGAAADELAPQQDYLSGDAGTVLVPEVNANRKMITEMNLSMETTAIEASVATISNAVKNLGGYLQSSSMSGNSINANDNLRYAYMTARVPQQHLEEFLTIISGTGNILQRSENVRDVTLQYTDTQDRIKTLEIEQDRLWELLAKAESMDSIIMLEQRLSEIRYELESFKSQLRTYDDQVNYATVYIDISEVRIFTPQSKGSVGARISKGFSENLSFITYAAIDTFVFIAAHLPALVILAAIGLLIWKVGKSRKPVFRKKAQEKDQQKDQESEE